MCGIAGFVASHKDCREEKLTVLAATMAATLAHRGPDDAGIWTDPAMGVALVDRAGMAYGLEVRVPFLDHRVIEYAWRLPPALKYNRRGGKPLLRRLLYRYVPAELVDRPKKGFFLSPSRLAPWPPARLGGGIA